MAKRALGGQVAHPTERGASLRFGREYRLGQGGFLERGLRDFSPWGEPPAETETLLKPSSLEASRLHHRRLAEHAPPLPDATAEPELGESGQIPNGGEQPGMGAHALKRVVCIPIMHLAHQHLR